MEIGCCAAQVEGEHNRTSLGGMKINENRKDHAYVAQKK